MEFLMSLGSASWIAEAITFSLISLVISFIALRGVEIFSPAIFIFVAEYISSEWKGTSISGIYANMDANYGPVIFGYMIVLGIVFLEALYTKYVKEESSDMFVFFVLFTLGNFLAFHGAIPVLAFFILYPFMAFNSNVYVAASRIARR